MASGRVKGRGIRSGLVVFSGESSLLVNELPHVLLYYVVVSPVCW